ncbi:MAG: FAD-dependent oxidoreductase [Pseudomonadota bacterium]
MMSRAEVAVIGAGLSGLALASMLQADETDVIVFEARDRAGGRVLSQGGFDLGPAWLWPHNTRLLSLARNLGLSVFAQHSAGNLVFENEQGQIRRDLAMATMGDALRIEGGLSTVTNALAQKLGSRLHLNKAVNAIEERNDEVIIETGDVKLMAGRAVLALPPRLMTKLGVKARDVPTWMAGHAKLVARYPTPFWREMGLNGDAISHCGPLAEIHDASPYDLSDGALFGFAVPGAASAPDFKTRSVEQLVRLFGSGAAAPTDVLVKDWSADPFTATGDDKTLPTTHPHYQPQHATHRLFFAGSENAAANGGFLEGAFEAAEAVYRQLNEMKAWKRKTAS